MTDTAHTSTVSSSQAVLNAILRSDLYSFVQAAFRVVSAGDCLVRNWHLEAITYALTRVLKCEIRRLIITVPPRSLKSICASVAFPAFVLGRDPTRRIICVSYSEALARKHANDCRALMRSPRYIRAFPKTRISGAKDTELEVMTTDRGFRLAASVGGTLTGRGGNLLIIDDPLKPQEAQSEAARDSLWQWYTNTLLSRLDNKADDAIILVMQRLHVDDLVGRLLEQGGWNHLDLPAIAEVDEAIPLGPAREYVRRAGHVLHPEREPRAVLEEIRRAMGSLEFSAQYQQRPIPLGGNLVKWAWFRTHEHPPAPASGDRIVVSWDTAMSARELSDYSACVVLLVRNGTAFVLDVVRERLEYPALRRKVVDVHRRWCNLADYILLIENKGSGMSLIQDLRRDSIHAIGVDPEGDKVMRMNAQTARIEAGAVSLPRRAPWLEEFQREIMAFPNGRHDDQVDALSQALKRAFQRRAVTTRTGAFLGAY